MDRLSIVLPCYNPPEDWAEYVTEAYLTLSGELNFTPQLIIVNDGSTVPIATAVETLRQKLNDIVYIDVQKNKGKGAALREGIAKARSEFIIYTDIDLPYSTKSVMAVYDALQDKRTDIAVGVKDKSYYHFLPPYRRFISKALRKGIQFFFRLPVNDTQCGLKGFNRRGRAVFLRTTIDRYLFDLEFIYLASRKNQELCVTPVEVTLRPNVIFRTMNMKILLEESKNFFKILRQTMHR